MVEITRDALGIPTVRGADEFDLAFGQGVAVAQDRTWQLEWLRRRALGTTAELLGTSAVAWDRLARRAGVAEVGQRSYAALTEESRAFVDAYVAGLNQGLQRHVTELDRLEETAQPWANWMPLAVFHAQHLLFGNLGTLLWRRFAADVLGDRSRLLDREGPQAQGSNAWALGGGRTATGMPLIAGDSHRNLDQPGPYLQIRLVASGIDVAGFTFAGVPGVQHFAHAGSVAWAITNACADNQDLVPLDPSRIVEERRESIEVRNGESVEVEIVRTEDGPVVDRDLVLRDTATELGEMGFDALLPLLRARTADEVEAAFETWVQPVNNLIVADTAGALRYRIVGRVPVRDGDRWVGWLGESNRVEVPADGQVVTANERRGPESAAIGSVFAPPYRADRIGDLLAGCTEATVDDFVAIHNDTLAGALADLAPILPAGLADFTGRMDAGSVGAGRFAAWRAALVRLLAAEPVFAGLHVNDYDAVFQPFLDPVYRLGLALPTLAQQDRPFGIDLVALSERAWEQARADADRWQQTWGERHVFAPLHAGGEDAAGVPPRPVDGDSDCVRCTGSYPALDDACTRGSVNRYVWDLADRSAGGWVVPTGAHGDVDSPHHHDQLDAWVTGRLSPMPPAEAR